MIERLNMVRNLIPKEIGTKVRVQSADQAGLKYLQWQGFQTETVLDGWHVMRRDFHDSAFYYRYPEPPLPNYRIEIL